MPLLAGAGAALVCALLAGGLALLGTQPARTIGARAPLPEAPVELARAEIPSDGPQEPAFSEGMDEDVALPGVEDAEAALNPSPEAAPVPAPVTPEAPLAGLFEPGPGGPLPIIASSGQRPDQAYAKAFDGDLDAPTIAVVIGGLGLNRALTLEAIETLPGEVTLSFVPYARDLQAWVDRARADGHEVLIELPMEPFDYPNNDPGPHTLLSDASEAENTRRLDWLLSRAAGYTGVINYLGARLGADAEALGHVFSVLETRGLTVFHDGSGRRPALASAQEMSGAQLALVDRLVDANPEASAIDNRLLELEALSLQNGTALGLGSPYPSTIENLAAWANSLPARGYQLAPASFVARQRLAAQADPES
ncbi:divergent polysaccharide deacetylase family protein [Marinicauda pacifica]|jgi:uncharacterized protein|uniref:divergent polysaccharide deacetylase family protein n=1 Tax=Marinicauda pacifica TaxID=1133559 RepID=UPI0035C80540